MQARRLIPAGFLALAACAPEAAHTSHQLAGPPLVYVVNEPLRCFTARIGAELVDVRFPVPPGIDPAFWEPGDEEIAAFQGAALILQNGAGYARWMQHATLPTARCVDTSAGFAERLIEEEGQATHSHGPAGAHSHGGTAFTTWLDVDQAAQQAAAVGDALVGLLPERRATFEQRYEELAAELRALDAEMAAAAPREPLLASHPVYQYRARRYGADVRSVLFELDAEPDDAGWAQLEALLAERPARLMLSEAEPLATTRARLEELGLRVVLLEPCGNRPERGDFLDAMRANLARL